MKEDESGKLLEGKVAQAASKKCSFEEVSALHDEVRDWLNLTPGKLDPEVSVIRETKVNGIIFSCRENSIPLFEL